MARRAIFKMEDFTLEVHADHVANDRRIGSKSTALQFTKYGFVVAHLEYSWQGRNARAIEEGLAIFLNSKEEL